MNDKTDKPKLGAFGFPVRAAAAPVPQGQAGKAKQEKPKARRLPRQSLGNPPPGAMPEHPGGFLGLSRAVVPVSAVARDWGISSRRVRVMLVEGRLEGRQLENGYWQVFHPYRYVFGTRGPAIKRQRELPPAPERREWNPDY
ncbi:MAG: hypothetical protein HKM01_08360 [Gallionella sp.]|nr:hypothetical protein [Gallionella sp.]